MSESLETRSIGSSTIYFGEKNGKYPDGNTLFVSGPEESLVIDPSLGLVARGDDVPAADRVLNSHCHEDHIAGNHLYPDSPWHLHHADRPAIRSLDGMLELYGLPEAAEPGFRKLVVEQFHFVPRQDAEGFGDGDVFDLGGGIRVHVVHTPGHTRGHSAFWVEPDDLLFIGDIDLSSFGPYYGDAWSSLEDFERSLRRVREFGAGRVLTFHHVGLLEDRESFLERLDRFEAVIPDRERRLLAYLREPHTIDEIVSHRFVYRPGDASIFVDAVERRSMLQHIDRLGRGGRVREIESGVYQTTA